MTDLAKLRARLQALRNKTTANGCTEAEALAAAEKAAELLSAHDVDEVELEASAYEELEVDLGGRRTVLDEVWKAVAYFVDCEGFLRQHGRRGFGLRWGYVYFGRPSDVLVAEYVHEVIRRAAETATKRFRASDDYKRRRTAKTRSRALKAFHEGFVIAMRRQLIAGLWRRNSIPSGGDGWALIQAQRAPLTAALEARHRALLPVSQISSATNHYRDARGQGFRAGRDARVEAPLAGAPRAPALLTSGRA
ncbi:DUF2786 domain-containing protein [Xanthobacter sp. VTT E-85241]|uniref:DUF7168 domain-containing protein n=1 Tax=Roseixanthobacter finlandensis TaxID=3119922 RepID=UPI00372A53D9